MNVILIASLVGGLMAQAPTSFKPDADGFIRNWLVLAPIAIDDTGAAAIDTAYLDGEPAIKPKPGDTVIVGNKPLTWKPLQASDYFVDFLQAFPERGENVTAYAVAYVHADQDMAVTLALSTNDQGKVWVNGKQVFKFAETRVLEKDADKINVALVKGQNVLVMKVVNEVNNWQACARFMKDGAAVTNLRIAVAPQ